MSNDDLCYLSAGETLRLYEEHKLSPVELTRAVIERAERVNPAINAFSDTYFDEALAQAKAAEARWMKPGRRRRRLEGIPLAVKDAQRVKGKRTTQGSLVFEHHVDDYSDPMVERLQKAGAIIHARTTTPEFCISGVCHSRLFGVTRNPWNTDYGPGGSSGGSAASLAAGTTLLATGTDIGGSIRIPAGCCGVVGFKPPHGRNPHGYPACVDRFDHCGPLTRTVADAALMQNVTAGPHPADHDSIRPRLTVDGTPRDVRGLRVAWSMDFDYMAIDEEVRRNTLAALQVFRDLGCKVEPVHLGWSADVERDLMHWINAMHFGRAAIWQARDNAHLLTDYALKMAAAAERTTTIDDVPKSWARIHAMYATFGVVMQEHDVFVCPTNALPAVAAEHDPSDPEFHVAGVKVDPEFGWILTHQFNMLHNCPVMAVPSGHAASGVPTGIQIVGRTYDDRGVFRAAAAYEQALGGWYASPDARPRIEGGPEQLQGPPGV